MRQCLTLPLMPVILLLVVMRFEFLCRTMASLAPRNVRVVGITVVLGHWQQPGWQVLAPLLPPPGLTLAAA